MCPRFKSYSCTGRAILQRKLLLLDESGRLRAFDTPWLNREGLLWSLIAENRPFGVDAKI